MRLLQDTLGATRRALKVAHPRCTGPSLKVHDFDHAERLAAIMTAHLVEMNSLVEAYQHAIHHQAILRQFSQIDLPF